MNIVVQSLRPEHRSAVRRVATPNDISPACPQNFNHMSECFAAIAFTNFPIPSNFPNETLLPVSQPSPQGGLLSAPPNATDVLPPNSMLNYTIHLDAGLGFIDVVHHAGDYERRVLPLQWAVDSVSGEVHVRQGVSLPDYH
jgi:ATP-binding cassette, subfamily A (ABC1), member 3